MKGLNHYSPLYANKQHKICCLYILQQVFLFSAGYTQWENYTTVMKTQFLEFCVLEKQIIIKLPNPVFGTHYSRKEFWILAFPVVFMKSVIWHFFLEEERRMQECYKCFLNGIMILCSSWLISHIFVVVWMAVTEKKNLSRHIFKFYFMSLKSIFKSQSLWGKTDMQNQCFVYMEYKHELLKGQILL